MTSCAVVSMTFHGKYGYIRLLRYLASPYILLASPYILYRLGKRVTQRTLVTLNVFLRKTAHLNPLHPLSGGFRDCPSRSLRDVLFALLSASAIFGWRHIYGCASAKQINLLCSRLLRYLAGAIYTVHASAKQINLLCSRLLRIFEVGSGYGPDRTVFARNRSNSGPVKPYDD